MSFNIRGEVPAGFTDADLLQAQYEEESRAHRAAIEAGNCPHSSTQGGEQDAMWFCYDCGRDVPREQCRTYQAFTGIEWDRESNTRP